jgi:hypothetical protein
MIPERGSDLRCSDLFSRAFARTCAASPQPDNGGGCTLRLRLLPDAGFVQISVTGSTNQNAQASGEQYVWPEASRRTGSSSGFGALMGEL